MSPLRKAQTVGSIKLNSSYRHRRLSDLYGVAFYDVHHVSCDLLFHPHLPSQQCYDEAMRNLNASHRQAVGGEAGQESAGWS